MPATTRSQNQRQHDLVESANSSPSRLSTKIVEDPSLVTTSTNLVQKNLAFEKPPTSIKAFSSLQKSPKQPRNYRSFDKCKQSQTATELSPSDLSDKIITHWACGTCSCSQGLFEYPIDSCICCEHTMDQHAKVDRHWDPLCDYVCERNDLVVSIMRLVDLMGVVVIRATPQAGKTTLLHLLGHHVLYKRRELEPVYIDWLPREERHDLPYLGYLEKEKWLWQEKNAKCRPRNPEARTLYLIDEGQESYEEVDLWARDFKSKNTRSTPMFVVVCLFGADVSLRRPVNVESRSLHISPVQRVELRPSSTNNPCILFSLDETTVVIQKWAICNQYKLTDDVYQYLYTATDGHPGMVGFFLNHFNYCVHKV